MLKKTTKKKRNANSKSKQKTQKPKRLKTFNQSNCSLLQDPPNAGSISDLFKNEALKKKHQPLPNTSQINFSSTINNYTSVYTVISSIHAKPEKTKSAKKMAKPQSQANKKKAPQKAKSKSKLTSQQSKQAKKKKQMTKHEQYNNGQRIESYELIPPSKNSLNSEIVFSIQQTKRQSQYEQKRKQQSSRIYDSLMRVSQENLINNNRLLRSTIKQQFKRKNEAATKIQKVFRGYLTRKILQKYIREQQQKLYGLLQNYKSSSINNYSSHNKPSNNQSINKISNDQSMNKPSNYKSIYKPSNHQSMNKAQSPSRSKSSQQDVQFFSNRTHDYSPKTFRDQQSINLSKVNPSLYRLEDSKVSSDRVHSNRFFFEREGEIVNCEDDVVSSEEEDVGVGSGEQGQEQAVGQEQQEQQVQNDDSQSSQDIIVYRHQEAIYNGAQIQQYLQSSSEQQQEDQPNSKLPKIISSQQIIFQTNQQHIQSRKNSLLNKDQPQNPQNNKHKHSKTIDIFTKDPAISSDIIFSEPQDTSNHRFISSKLQNTNHQFIDFNQTQDIVDQDLIKTSKVNSIHSHSQKGSIKSSEAVSPKNKKQILCAQNKTIEQPSDRTSKKQCKKIICQNKHQNIDPSPNTSTFCASNQNNHITPSLTIENPTQHLNTIKLPVTQKFSPPNATSKRAFMDTISYNTEFKNKHQITTNEQISKRKDSMKKKKIYYFSEDSDQEEERRKATTPSSVKSLSKAENPNELQRLKNLQMQRWDQVIRLMNCQLKDMTQTSGKSKQFQSFIKQVMDLSLKNKQILKEMMSHQNSLDKSQRSQGTFKNSRIDEILQQKDSQDNEEKLKRWKDFKETLSSGRRKSITQQDIAVFKPNSRVILTSKHVEKQKMENNFVGSPKEKPFFMQPKMQLKQKLTKLQSESFHLTQSQTREFTLANIQNDQIQQMLKIRQQTLQKRQCQELTKLNEQLIKKQLTQKEFLQKLKQLTDGFQLQKLSIDKAREDISKGYSAAVKLIREAYCDARKIGYKLPLSKSSDSYKLNKHVGFGVLAGLNNVIIDQLNAKEQVFAMKHVKGQRLEGEIGQANQEKDQRPMIKAPKQISEKLSRLSALEAQYIDSNQFTHSHHLQAVVSNNASNNFSQSSSSIINNLISSQNSFSNHLLQNQARHLLQNQPRHLLQSQISAKHQPTSQCQQTSGKSNIFTQNEHSFDDMSEQSSEIEFSQEELKRFRKAQPYDPSIADMNRNLMIGKEFFEMQKFTDDGQKDFGQHHKDSRKGDDTEDPENMRMRLYRQVYEIEEQSMDSVGGQEQYQLSRSKGPKIQLIAEKQIQLLIFEMCTQLLMKPLFSEKFLQAKRQQMFGIRRVSDECRKDFIRLVENFLPSKEQIFTKINQNISPVPKQLLKCMRIDFSQDEQQDNTQEYEQIGKYEMILDQDMCNSAIDKYHQKIVEEKQNKIEIQMLTGDTVEGLKQQFGNMSETAWQDKVFAYLQQRQKFVANRKQHCDSIRWQFINMELHCLFDAWNQQIIQLKNNQNGFSGIGLNQLTLSMIDRNRRVNESQVQEIIQLSKFKLMKLLNYEEDIINQINYQACRQVSVSQSQISASSLKNKLQESWQKFSWVYVPNKDVDEELDTQEESRWVYYADEALSYGLELVYLVEEELFSELAKDLRKLTIKGQFL